MEQKNNNMSISGVAKNLFYGVIEDVKNRSDQLGYLAPFAYILASATEVGAGIVEHRLQNQYRNNLVASESSRSIKLSQSIKMFYDDRKKEMMVVDDESLNQIAFGDKTLKNLLFRGRGEYAIDIGDQSDYEESEYQYKVDITVHNQKSNDPYIKDILLTQFNFDKEVYIPDAYNARDEYNSFSMVGYIGKKDDYNLLYSNGASRQKCDAGLISFSRSGKESSNDRYFFQSHGDNKNCTLSNNLVIGLSGDNKNLLVSNFYNDGTRSDRNITRLNTESYDISNPGRIVLGPVTTGATTKAPSTTVTPDSTIVTTSGSSTSQNKFRTPNQLRKARQPTIHSMCSRYFSSSLQAIFSSF